MSSSALPLDPPRELPARSDAVRPAERGRWWSRLGLDTLYLLVGFPVAIASFVVLLVGLSLSIAWLLLIIGIPLVIGTLYVAGGFAAIERARLRLRGDVIPTPIYRPINWNEWRGPLRPLADRQRWLDFAHGLLVFPVAVITWSLAVTWWAGALGGLTYPLWGWAIPRGDDEGDTTLSELLGFDGFAADAVLNVLIGLFFAATLYAVIRGSAAVQAALGRQLLAGNYTRALQQRVASLEESRSAAVQAEAQTLRKLERDLHDGPQQRLVRLTMDLSAAQRRLETDPEAAKPLVTEALLQTQEALAELRALSRGIAPPILIDRGLPAAVAALASRSTVPVVVDAQLPQGARPPAAAENAIYFVVAEALTNVAKHSGATQAHVWIRLTNGVLQAQVSDNGRGGAHPAKGHGLGGLIDRLSAVDGRLVLESPPGGPTVLLAEVPCVSS
jgi:signal transduction histidine kinase